VHTPPTLTSISMWNFRGVVGPMTIELEPTTSRGGVTFVLGDNGSGKSSVCDAIEFATRSLVSRRLRDGEKHQREIRNLSTTNPPGVIVRLANGDSYARGQVAADSLDGASIIRGNAIAGFDRAPVVIRRDAVESFWKIPAAHRLDYFWDYLKPPTQQVRSSADDAWVEEHRAAEHALARARRSLDCLVPPHFYSRNWKFPTHSKNASSAINAGVKEALRRSDKPRTLTAEQRIAINACVAALTEEESLRSNARSAESKKPRDPAPVGALIDKIGPRIAYDFFGIFGQDWIQDIEFNVDHSGLVDIRLITDDEALAPDRVLSEAGLDVLSLLIAVEAHVETASSHGQSPSIVFDDVFQSVDAPLRSRVLAHLAARLDRWQVVFTVHDRLWLEVAEQRFKEANFATRVLELRSGGFGGTPKVYGPSTGLLRDLRDSIENAASAVVVAGVAGRTLEALAEQLSYRLSAKVARRERDRYELNDIWLPVRTEIDSSQMSVAKQLTTDMSNTQFLRNRVGAHANDWADGLSDAEALDAANQVMTLAQQFLCQSCAAWGKRKKTGSSWTWVFHCCTQSSPTATS